QGERSPDRAVEHLRAGEFAIDLRRRRDRDQVPRLGQRQEVSFHERKRRATETVFRPADFAGRPFDATQMRAILLAAFDAVEKTVAVDARVVMVREYVVALPERGDAVAAQLPDDRAGAVRRGDEDLIV